MPGRPSDSMRMLPIPIRNDQTKMEISVSWKKEGNKEDTSLNISIQKFRLKQIRQRRYYFRISNVGHSGLDIIPEQIVHLFRKKQVNLIRKC